MKTIFWCGWIFFAVQGAYGQGPLVAIEPAMEVSFSTVTNRFYRRETVSALTPDQWSPLTQTLWGNGSPLKQCVRPTATTQFFRTIEFDLTNGLRAYFPF